MKAILCALWVGCRYQQDTANKLRLGGMTPDGVWANDVGCDDKKTDIEQHCEFFRLKGQTIQVKEKHDA
jgi:hypothetical protein